MAKPTIVRIFYGSVIAVVAGLVLGFMAVWIAFVNDAFVMDGGRDCRHGRAGGRAA
jgi:ABC-type nitrate/sulfonate/bicarbonate transport system permease component